MQFLDYVAKLCIAESDFKYIVCILITKYKNIDEIKSVSWLGDDVVGMSIVYEAMTVAQMKIDVLEITHVSNVTRGRITNR
jgi:purine nucleoside phosphorylase